MEEFVKEEHITQGGVNIHGVEVPYVATAENFPIKAKDGVLQASTYTYSYQRNDLENVDGRPVLFAWNGGPGAASLFVHLGLLAPMRVKCGNGIDMPQTAPFEMCENEECLLDVCDIVVVDAIGTGYAKLYREESRKYWYTTEHDAEAIIVTMRQWMSRHDRWNNPVYIMGESYGTIRNAMVAEGLFINGTDAALQHVSGIVMLGSALNYGQKDFPIDSAVLNLPSIAAANWYWHREGKGKLEDFMEKCNKFCYEEYLPALARGNELNIEEKKSIAEKLHEFIGYSVEKILEDNLAVDIFEYPAKGLVNENKSIGIYDSRFALGKIKNAKQYDYFADDACNAIGMPAFMACFNSVWKKKLGITNEDEYTLLDMATEGNWDFHTQKYPPVALEDVMHRNPKLKVMFGMGRYDMLTTIGWCHYLVNHYDYPKENVTMKYYNAGHMPYLDDKEAAVLLQDLREFITI